MFVLVLFYNVMFVLFYNFVKVKNIENVVLTSELAAVVEFSLLFEYSFLQYKCLKMMLILILM